MLLSVFYAHIQEAARKASLPLAETLDRLCDAGVGGIDIEYRQYRAEEVVLKPLLNARGMRVASFYHFADFAHAEETGEACEAISAAAEIGCGNVLVIPGFRREGEEDSAVIPRITAALKTLVAYGQERGVAISLEDFDDARTTYQDSAGLQQYLDNVPGLRCTFDTGNFLPAGEPPLTAFSVLAPSVVHVHCKDREQSTNHVRIFGQGDVDFPALFSRLQSAGYTGALTVEQFCEEGTTIDGLVTAAAALRRAWSDAKAR